MAGKEEQTIQHLLMEMQVKELELNQSMNLVTKDLEHVLERIESLEETKVNKESFEPIRSLHQKMLTAIVVGILAMVIKQIFEL